MGSTTLDQFINAVEAWKVQLEELVSSYREFRRRLEALPPEMAQEAERILAKERATIRIEKPEQDLAGKTALECAKIILTGNNNEPMHFSAIAKEALRRGYKGRGDGDRDQVETRTIQSFWAALHRSNDFLKAGRGNYQLSAGPGRLHD